MILVKEFGKNQQSLEVIVQRADAFCTKHSFIVLITMHIVRTPRKASKSYNIMKHSGSSRNNSILPVSWFTQLFAQILLAI